MITWQKRGESCCETGHIRKQIGIFYTETRKTSSSACAAIVVGRQGDKLPPVLLVWDDFVILVQCQLILAD
jgi:hypothetical protein